MSTISCYPTVQLRYVATTGTGHTPSRRRPDLWVESERVIPWMTLADVGTLRDGSVDVVRDTAERITPRGLASSAAVIHPAGTVLLSRTASVGFTAIMGRDMAVSQDFMTWTPGPRLSSRFLLYVLRGMRFRLLGLMHGSTHKTIYMPDLQALRTPLPPIGRQRAIAGFLDRETARITALQARCSALRENLAEAAIARFAELTAQHPKTQVGLHYDVQLGKMLDETRVVDGDFVPYLRNLNVGWDQFDLGDVKQMRLSGSERRRYEVRPGDLLACEGRHVGKCAIWEGQISPIYYQKALHRIRPRASSSNRFLLWCLWLGSTRGDYYADGTGATIPHLPAEKMRRVRIPSVDRREQDRIVDEVDDLHRRAARAAAVAARLHTRMTEYRDALITEAVTGRLDVTRLSDTQLEERAHAAAEADTSAVKSLVATAE